jgi:hypothetical protein
VYGLPDADIAWVSKFPLKFPLLPWIVIASGVPLIVTVTVAPLAGNTVLVAFATWPEIEILA